LTSTLENGQFACRGSRVTFTCETRGSGGIAWTSDTYVGPNGAQLVIDGDFDDPRATLPSPSNVETVATLTREEEDQGVRVLESMLSINPLPDPQNTSVTCIHTASGQRNITTFQVIGMLFYAVAKFNYEFWYFFNPDVPATLKNVVPVPIKHEGNCVIHTVWESPNHYDVTQYEVSANWTQTSADTDVIDTNVNETRISALFSISCGV
jgi:hypothetical protein